MHSRPPRAYGSGSARCTSASNLACTPGRSKLTKPWSIATSRSRTACTSNTSSATLTRPSRQARAASSGSVRRAFTTTKGTRGASVPDEGTWASAENFASQSMDDPGLIPSLIGAPLSPRGGGVAGTIEDLLVDPASHRPVWLLVRLRHSARPYTFVPAQRMASRADAIVVPYDDAALRSAPVRLDGPGPLRREHAIALSRHYGVRAPESQVRGLRAGPAQVSRFAA